MVVAEATTVKMARPVRRVHLSGHWQEKISVATSGKGFTRTILSHQVSMKTKSWIGSMMKDRLLDVGSSRGLVILGSRTYVMGQSLGIDRSVDTVSGKIGMNPSVEDKVVPETVMGMSQSGMESPRTAQPTLGKLTCG